MNRRAFTTMALVFSAVVFAAALPRSGFAQSNPLVGTWKLNLAKSKYPGQAPRSNTMTVEAVGKGERLTTEGVDGQGNPTKVEYGVILPDGKSYPVTGAQGYDANSMKQLSSTTTEITRTKAGTVVQLLTSVLSSDGKTVTYTVRGVNGNGPSTEIIAVYDKQ
jgi:hypothetical protein